jgi:hypothetical protein
MTRTVRLQLRLLELLEFYYYFLEILLGENCHVIVTPLGIRHSADSPILYKL